MNTAVLGNGHDDDPDEWDETDTSGVHARRLEPGERVADRYLIRGELGHGGFAVVYDAEHLGLGRSVAVKVLHLQVDTPTAMLERFRREARISALVRHPNVLEVYDTGVLADGSPYLVMERIHGETLSERLQKQTLTIAAVVEVARQLLTALSVLDEHGIVHRDIKPENLMLHDAGGGRMVVKVLDFGISKRVLPEVSMRLTSSGALVGTPHYMSPEQLRSEDVDVRTDVYSTGVVLYEALTGRVPYDGPSFSELVLAALHNKVRPIRQLRSGCPFELERIVLKALSRNRNDRYPTPAAMLTELEAFAARHRLPRGADAFRWAEQRRTWPTRMRESTEPRTNLVLGHLRAALPESLTGRLALVAAVLLLQLGGFAMRQRSLAAKRILSTPTHAQAPAEASTGQGLAHAESSAVVLPTPVTEPILGSAGAPIVEELESTDGLAAPAPVDAAPSLLEPSPEPAVAARLEVIPAFELEPAELAVPDVTPASAALQPERAAAPKRGEDVAKSRPERRSRRERHTSVDVNRGLASQAPEAPTPSAADEARGRSSSAAVLDEALASYVLGRYSRAHHLYRRAVRLLPKEASAWRGLGLVAARREDYAEARDALERYLALAPDAPDARAIRARINALPW